MVLSGTGNYERARALHEESLALSREVGSRRGIALGVSNLGEVAYYQGDYEAAKAYCEESLQLTREARDLSFGVYLNNLGEVMAILGDYERAESLFEEAVAVFRESGAKYGLAPSLQNLAGMRLRRRECEQAAALLRESIGIARETGDRATIASCLERCAELTAAEERFDGAARLFGAADALREASWSPRSHVDLATLELALDAARRQLDETAWTRSSNEGRAMPLQQAVEYTLASLKPASPSASPWLAAGGQLASLTRREREIAGLIAQWTPCDRCYDGSLGSAMTFYSHSATTPAWSLCGRGGRRTRSEERSISASAEPDLWVGQRALRSLMGGRPSRFFIQ